VRTSSGAGDGFEALQKIVGERVGGRDGVPSGLDLNPAVAAGGLDEFPDGPSCPSIQRLTVSAANTIVR
jgi:hypothetical protein